MPHPRTILSPTAMFVLLALTAFGCTSSDDDGDQPAAQLGASVFQVSSPNFSEIRLRVRIPKTHTCYGENLSPPLAWSGAPDGTVSYALVAEDVDHHTGIWVHWVLYNIPAVATQLVEGIPTTTEMLPDGMLQGTNDDTQPGYQGPCPIPVVVPGTGEGWEGQYKALGLVAGAHQYFFRLYALDTKLGLAPRATKTELESAMEGHILAEAETVGKFQLAPVVDYKQELRESLEQTPSPGPSPTP